MVHNIVLVPLGGSEEAWSERLATCCLARARGISRTR